MKWYQIVKGERDFRCRRICSKPEAIKCEFDVNETAHQDLTQHPRPLHEKSAA